MVAALPAAAAHPNDRTRVVGGVVVNLVKRASRPPPLYMRSATGAHQSVCGWAPRIRARGKGPVDRWIHAVEINLTRVSIRAGDRRRRRRVQSEMEEPQRERERLLDLAVDYGFDRDFAVAALSRLAHIYGTPFWQLQRRVSCGWFCFHATSSGFEPNKGFKCRNCRGETPYACPNKFCGC